MKSCNANRENRGDANEESYSMPRAGLARYLQMQLQIFIASIVRARVERLRQETFCNCFYFLPFYEVINSNLSAATCLQLHGGAMFEEYCNIVYTWGRSWITSLLEGVAVVFGTKAQANLETFNKFPFAIFPLDAPKRSIDKMKFHVTQTKQVDHVS